MKMRTRRAFGEPFDSYSTGAEGVIWIFLFVFLLSVDT
jgi:hypothetical protein